MIASVLSGLAMAASPPEAPPDADEVRPALTPRRDTPRPPATPPPDLPAGSTGTVEVTLQVGSGMRLLDIKCDGVTQRWRALLLDGRAKALGVPTAEFGTCLGLLKGLSMPLEFNVAGGMRYDCTVDQNVAACDATALPAE